MSIGNIAYGASMGHVWDTFYRRNPSKFVDIENESSVQPLKNGAPGRSSSIFKNVASRAIRGNAKIGIITNGFSALQQVRLERTGLRDYFDLLVISEEVGVAKPNKKIFDYALEQAGNPDRSRVLMVGDTAESDILGGINAGLATCWLNAHNREQPEGIAPTWTVSSLHELEQLLCKH